MGQTDNYQIPYPELNNAPDGPSQMRGLAERVDLKLHDEIVAVNNGLMSLGTQISTLAARITATESSIATINTKIADTGSLALTVSYATGWAAMAATGCLVRKFGPVVNIYFYVKRTGAAITASSTGNITDSQIATITNTAYQPLYTHYGIWHNTATGSPWESAVSTAGSVQIIAAMRGGSVINTGDEIRGNYTWIA